jgi:uncharacterized protein
MIIVSDTSPISALLRIGEADLLHTLFGEVIIPNAVGTELLRKHTALPTWLRVEQIKDQAMAQSFKILVDPGEAEAIQLAKEIGADRLLIDDNKGRKLAEREGLKVIGLLGVVLTAKANGLIPSARLMIQRLRSGANIYLAEDIVAKGLKSVGE